MTRLALLTEIPAPYRIPLFNALTDRLELTVLFLALRNPERPYRLHADELRFRWRALPGRDVTLGRRWVVLNRRVRATLREARPEVVLLGGWNQPAFWSATVWAGARRLPVVVWVESTRSDRRTGRLEGTKRRLLGTAAAFVVPGRAACDYLVDLGVPLDRIAIAPNAVDPAVFSSVPRVAGNRNDRPVVLAVGRLATEKGLDVLLGATRDLPADVVLAGTGPDERRLRALAGANVRFLGQVDRDALPALYASADVLAMPSLSDPWGMVLNEAALAGLPLVATDAAGAALELIEDGANGFRVPRNDTAALRAALARLIGDPRLRERMGERSREIAGGFTPSAWAEAVARVVDEVRR